jgi:hypothetical protein
MIIDKTTLEIVFAELSWDFYAIRIDGAKIYEFDEIKSIMGINPYPMNEDELSQWILSNPELFENYDIEHVYIDIQ